MRLEANVHVRTDVVMTLKIEAPIPQRGHQRHRVQRGRLEADAKKEIPRPGRQRVGDHGTDADGFGGGGDAKARVTHQRAADAPAQQRAVDGQPAQLGHRHEIGHRAAQIVDISVIGASGEGSKPTCACVLTLS